MHKNLFQKISLIILACIFFLPQVTMAAVCCVDIDDNSYIYYQYESTCSSSQGQHEVVPNQPEYKQCEKQIPPDGKTCCKQKTTGEPRLLTGNEQYPCGSTNFEPTNYTTCVPAGATPPQQTQATTPPPAIYKPVLEIPIPGIKFSDLTVNGQEMSIPWIAQYISGIYYFALYAGAILAVVVIMGAGFVWLTSQGNQSTIGRAKEYISNALIGILILLGSYALLYNINPQLVELAALKIISFTGGAFVYNTTSSEDISGSNAAYGTNKDIWGCSGFYAPAIASAATKTGTPEIMVRAIMDWENRGTPRPCARSNAKAVGVMQVVPSTAEHLGYSGETGSCDPKNPATATGLYNIETNVYYGSKRIRSCMGGKGAKMTDENGNTTIDYQLVAACYNGGEKAIEDSTSCAGTVSFTENGKTYTRPRKAFECTSVKNNYGETRQYVKHFKHVYAKDEYAYCTQ